MLRIGCVLFCSLCRLRAESWVVARQLFCHRSTTTLPYIFRPGRRRYFAPQLSLPPYRCWSNYSRPFLEGHGSTSSNASSASTVRGHSPQPRLLRAKHEGTRLPQFYNLAYTYHCQLPHSAGRHPRSPGFQLAPARPLSNGTRLRLRVGGSLSRPSSPPTAASIRRPVLFQRSEPTLSFITMPRDPAVSAASGGSGFFSRNNSGNTAPMRGMLGQTGYWELGPNCLPIGLVTFIADLRNARARELEEKRINKELANIRYSASALLFRIPANSPQAKIQGFVRRAKSPA